jgi:hypothetical protein
MHATVTLNPNNQYIEEMVRVLVPGEGEGGCPSAALTQHLRH